MTILLNSLLIGFMLIEVPLLSLMLFLYNHRGENGTFGELRKIIFVVTAGKFIFILGEIVLVLSALIPGTFTRDFIIGMFSVTTFIVLVTNWYAFFKIQKYL